jgi:hypothetical protein
MTVLAAGGQRAPRVAPGALMRLPSPAREMARRLLGVLLVLVAFGMGTGIAVGWAVARGVHALLGLDLG